MTRPEAEAMARDFIRVQWRKPYVTRHPELASLIERVAHSAREEGIREAVSICQDYSDPVDENAHGYAAVVGIKHAILALLEPKI